MARRTIDPSMLAGLVEGSMSQEVKKGSSKSIDPNFPVFSTPVNEDIIVYIPKVNVISTENGEEMSVLPALIHDAKIGKQFKSIRCIHGLTGGFYDQLGYDGSCPSCEGMAEVWELYNAKMAAEAKRMGVDLQNDPNDTMKPIREKLLRDMDLKGAEEFVTFPICIIPTKARFTPADNAEQEIKTVFVQWRKKRYEEKIIKGLDSLINNPGHPAGMFWFWQFTYDAKGKQHTAMDSARNARYSPINDPGFAETFNRFIPICEEQAKEFTILKAAEVVVANQFSFKEDIEAEVGKVLAKTRNQLEVIKLGGTEALAIEGGQPASAENALANFGVAPEQPVALGGGQVAQQGIPQGQPMGQPQGQPAGQVPNPVNFG